MNIASLSDYEQIAQQIIPANILSYIAGGSGDENTLRANRSDFTALKLMPKLLACEELNTSCKLLGEMHDWPILTAPVAYQKLVHQDGEKATQQASQAQDIRNVVSTLASTELEQLAGEPTKRNWFQLYCQADIAVSLDLVKRAEIAGYGAIVITLDATVNGLRNREQRVGFSLPRDVAAVNLTRYAIEKPNSITELLAAAPSWHDIETIINATQLPVLIKGVLNPLDAAKAMALGAKGVVVSNHGGRVLDDVPTSISMVASIRQALGNDATIILDSGVRRGNDIVKALALGADAVMIGRPIFYGLAVNGALGVAHSLKLLKDELHLAMALIGANSLSDITVGCLHRS